MKNSASEVLDGHFLVARLDVDVARPPLQRVEDGRVHQFDHRGDVAVGSGQLVDREGFVLIALIRHHVQREAFGDFLQHALRLLGLLQQLGDLRKRRHFHAQLSVEEQRQFVDQVQISRIGKGYFQRPVLRAQRHEIVAEHQIHRDGAEKVVIDGAVAKIDKFAAVARRGSLRFLDFRGSSGAAGREGGQSGFECVGGHKWLTGAPPRGSVTPI